MGFIIGSAVCKLKIFCPTTKMSQFLRTVTIETLVRKSAAVTELCRAMRIRADYAPTRFGFVQTGSQ